MKNKSFKSFRYVTLLAALIAAVGFVNRLQAQPATTPPSAPVPAPSSLSLLEDAYAALAQAKHDYNGHRGEAMEQVKLAAKELGGKIKDKEKAKGRESKSDADAELKTAQALLKQAAPGLKDKPLAHVNKALKQIDLALAVRK